MWFNSLQSMSLLVQLIAFLSLSSWKSIGVGAFHSTFQPVRTKFGNFAKEPTLSTNSKLYMSSTSSGSQHAPKGCAATPYMKKKVAVFGAGGYIGSTIFGFLQRASSLYGTGLGGPSTPRSISATAFGSTALNSVLSKHFKLAYASEYMVVLTNMMDSNYIKKNLKGMDAAILGTKYALETRPVTGNTYETSPNSKTNEIYLGGLKRSIDEQEGLDDLELQATMFRNSVQACVDAGLKHIIVLQTTQDDDSKAFAEILDEFDIPFTYVCYGRGVELKNVKDWTFEDGVQGNINIESFTLSNDYKKAKDYENGDWMDSLEAERRGTESSLTSIPTAREDVAALTVQCLMSLDWDQKRVLEIGTGGQLSGIGWKGDYTMMKPNAVKSDVEKLLNA